MYGLDRATLASLSHGDDGGNGEAGEVADRGEQVIVGVDDREFFGLPDPDLGALDVD